MAVVALLVLVLCRNSVNHFHCSNGCCYSVSGKICYSTLSLGIVLTRSFLYLWTFQGVVNLPSVCL